MSHTNTAESNTGLSQRGAALYSCQCRQNTTVSIHQSIILTITRDWQRGTSARGVLNDSAPTLRTRRFECFPEITAWLTYDSSHDDTAPGACRTSAHSALAVVRTKWTRTMVSFDAPRSSQLLYPCDLILSINTSRPAIQRYNTIMVSSTGCTYNHSYHTIYNRDVVDTDFKSIRRPVVLDPPTRTLQAKAAEAAKRE